MDKHKAKKNLREEIKGRIQQLDQDYCRKASQAICQKVLADPAYQEAETVFCFVGIKGEPDTRAILEDALGKGKRVCVPLCVSDGIMEARQIRNPKEDLRAGYLGILEPEPSCAKVNASEIDFALLPCVTCDHQGNRLGHGKGYYDRFLAGCHFDTVMICFEKLITEEIPMDAHDKKADRVITDAE